MSEPTSLITTLKQQLLAPFRRYVSCPVCGQRFNRHQAMDESWLHPQKHFGCPHCRTWFTTNPFQQSGNAGIPAVLMGFGLLWLMLELGPGRRIIGALLLLVGLGLYVYNRVQFVQAVSGLKATQH